MDSPIFPLLQSFTYCVVTSRSRRPSKLTNKPKEEINHIDVVLIPPFLPSSLSLFPHSLTLPTLPLTLPQGFNLSYEQSSIIDNTLAEAIHTYQASQKSTSSKQTPDLRLCIDVFINKQSNQQIPIERWWLGIHPKSSQSSLTSPLDDIDSFNDDETAALATLLRSLSVLTRNTSGHLYHDQLKKQIGSPDSLSFSISLSQTKQDPVSFDPLFKYSIPPIDTLNNVIISIAVEYSSHDRTLLDTVSTSSDNSTFDFASSSSLMLSSSMASTTNSQDQRFPFSNAVQVTSDGEGDDIKPVIESTTLLNGDISLNAQVGMAQTTTLSSKDTTDFIQVESSNPHGFNLVRVSSTSNLSTTNSSTTNDLPFHQEASKEADLVHKTLEIVNNPILEEQNTTNHSIASSFVVEEHQQILNSMK
eukprot:TRINITY_DN746_c1_g4_i1.p1 TRINITY_DN746_c1_g4~~TRINITY_DN746_c1_g4_i1.p1  ORF type:complete len:417 (-),score=83.94 TRINITY_DN746_c1_g4_i1:61-1311(-)